MIKMYHVQLLTTIIELTSTTYIKEITDQPAAAVLYQLPTLPTEYSRARFWKSLRPSAVAAAPP